MLTVRLKPIFLFYKKKNAKPFDLTFPIDSYKNYKQLPCSRRMTLKATSCSVVSGFFRAKKTTPLVGQRISASTSAVNGPPHPPRPPGRVVPEKRPPELTKN